MRHWASSSSSYNSNQKRLQINIVLKSKSSRKIYPVPISCPIVYIQQNSDDSKFSIIQKTWFWCDITSIYNTPPVNTLDYILQALLNKIHWVIATWIDLFSLTKISLRVFYTFSTFPFYRSITAPVHIVRFEYYWIFFEHFSVLRALFTKCSMECLEERSLQFRITNTKANE